MDKSKIDVVAREMRREYFRQWRAANKDKVKRHNATYWRKLAERKMMEQKAVDADRKEV